MTPLCRTCFSGERSRAGPSLAPVTTAQGNNRAEFLVHTESMAWLAAFSMWLLENSPTRARLAHAAEAGRTIWRRRWQEPTFGARRTRNTPMETSARPPSPSGGRCGRSRHFPDRRIWTTGRQRSEMATTLPSGFAPWLGQRSGNGGLRADVFLQTLRSAFGNRLGYSRRSRDLGFAITRPSPKYRLTLMGQLGERESEPQNTSI